MFLAVGVFFVSVGIVCATKRWWAVASLFFCRAALMGLAELETIYR